MYMSVSLQLVLCTCLIFKGKPFEELGERQQRRQKAKIRDALNTTCSELNNIGLSLKSAELETTSQEKIHLQIATEEDLENNKCHSDQIKDIAYLMLKHGVSNTFYHELCARFKDLPRAYKVYMHIKLLSSYTALYIATTHIYVYYS